MCDRKAVTIAIHLNSGYDIETAAQMKEAIKSCGGVHSVSMTVCSPPDTPPNKSTKWEKVSYVSNLHYSPDGIRTWRAYNIRAGKSVPWTKFSISEEFELQTVEASPLMSEASASLVAVRPRQTGGHSPVAEEEDSSEVKMSQAIPCILLPILDYLPAQKRDASSLLCGIYRFFNTQTEEKTSVN